MFTRESRYAKLGKRIHREPDGREIVYVERRFAPSGESLPLLVEATVQQGDRLDLLSARTLGSSELFWRIADANDALAPLALAARPGRRLRVPMPQV